MNKLFDNQKPIEIIDSLIEIKKEITDIGISCYWRGVISGTAEILREFNFISEKEWDEAQSRGDGKYQNQIKNSKSVYSYNEAAFNLMFFFAQLSKAQRWQKRKNTWLLIKNKIQVFR